MKKFSFSYHYNQTTLSLKAVYSYICRDSPFKSVLYEELLSLKESKSNMSVEGDLNCQVREELRKTGL
jgi:hypothetical protein